MIYIDFIGGSHGNFLEVVCNLAAGTKMSDLPFNSNGASHSKKYIGRTLFESGHYSVWKKPIASNRVISIRITKDDLLPLIQISLLRAGDFGYHSNELEQNTFHKLNNGVYSWVLDNIIKSFFENQIQKSYNAIKDPSWPVVYNLDEFERLPDWIKQECKGTHNLELLELSAQHPHCPRHVLREFFQIGFEQPNMHGFMQQQSQMVYSQDIDVYYFDYSKFYCSEFLNEVKHVAQWADIVYTNEAQQQVAKLHKEFLKRQPFKDSKQKCDCIVQDIVQGQQPPSVNLLEESYINAELKRQGYECRY